MSTPDKTLEGAVKTEAGVEVNGILIQPVVEQCAGCERVRAFEGQEYCSSYPASAISPPTSRPSPPAKPRSTR